MTARHVCARLVRIAARVERKARRALGLPPPRVRRDWSRPFETLRARWSTIPIGPRSRESSRELLRLSDRELLALWKRSRTQVTTGSEWDNRGWYHERYREELRGRRVLDVGCGFGIDSLTFAEFGADVTLMDLDEGNLDVVRRVARLLGVNVTVLLIRDLGSFDALGLFDFVCALGSLHHAPADVIRPEMATILRHLPPGGRWLQLAYPFTRWIREGRPPLDAWGQMTDGAGTPWAEPYDLPKLLDMLAPAAFEPVLCREFHGGDFIWFDLRRTG